ncbi:MAG TPA: TetR family transcriptional regulator, partial [Pseudorhodoplanes sp.]|nr:TetR family transcriptional regulator [Pseudorhodoplanes sp.]
MEVAIAAISTGRRGPRVARARNTGRSEAFDARAALLDATADLLRENNGTEPSVQEIARRAGVNAGLISYYFEGKDGLLRALLAQNYDQGLSQLRVLVESDRPIVEKLRLHITALINLNAAYPYLNQLTLIVVSRSDAAVSKEIADNLVRPLADAHAALINEGVASGELRPV